MKKHYRFSGLVLLVAVLFTGIAAAAPWQDSGYVRVEVPDMVQGMTFFRDALACQPMGSSASTSRSSTTPTSSLMSCGSDLVVELIASPAPIHPANHGVRPVRLLSDNLTGADQWLRRQGVQVLGPPRTRGGETVVNFIAPWGLKMQLISWHTNVTTAGP